MDKGTFAKLFCANTQLLRERAGFSQKNMAAALGVTVSTYKVYETRTLLPHRLVRSFALICRIPIETLYDIEDVQPDPVAKAKIRIAGANRGK